MGGTFGRVDVELVCDVANKCEADESVWSDTPLAAAAVAMCRKGRPLEVADTRRRVNMENGERRVVGKAWCYDCRRIDQSKV